MSVFAGPEINNSGLALALDADNIDKSWKGAPTTNLYQDTFGASGTLDGFGGASFLDTALVSQNPFNTGIVYARKSNAGVATFSVQADLTAGVTYTYSIWCKPLFWTNVSMRRNEPSVYVAESKNVTVIPGVWTRVSFTFTVSAGKTGSQVVGIGVGDANLGADNRGIYLYGAMLEQQSFATPYTNTSRLNTQSLLDLTGKNTITVDNLTYSNTGTFSFDGTDDFISGNLTPLAFNSSSTIEAVVKLTDVTGLRAIFSHGRSGVAFNSGLMVSGGQIAFRNSNSDYVFPSPTTLSPNVWYHLVVSTDSNGTTGYCNGISQGSNIYKLSTSALSEWTIGRRSIPNNTERLSGSLAILNVYQNRALTAAEVRQNFNALRGRYGI
jgi:hypothetical protein